ncbi:bifunctional heptose 7-phosphate kinase/heptose 1-phosphate adenyltransferase [Saccharicrinis sp. FJH54]|uniref:bifunctional heptose 7-phosphate kinase/heptose 1-phosphate adenyltransferase n=1 Tax=Saccharicrinis sp. FJH54 TaxID=3344665 RepID=UPI0035D51C6C
MFISNYIDSFKSKHILIIGDVMVDSYLWGSVKRISPEAPVPILSRSRREHRLGGAANVARNIKQLGAIPLICSVIGDDSNGSEFRTLLNEKNQITDRYIVSDPSRPTTIKTRIISGGQQLLRVDDEVTDPLSHDIELELEKTIEQCIRENTIDAVIIEDYDKGIISEELIQKINELFIPLTVPVFVDPKRKNFFSYKNVTLFKPNFNEFCAGINKDLEKDDIVEIEKQAKLYKEKYNIRNMLITLSEHGMLLSGEENLHIPAQKRDIADVSGAGDTVISVIAVCYSAGMPMEMAAKAANIAGGLVCTKSGVVPVDMDELLRECERIYKI